MFDTMAMTHGYSPNFGMLLALACPTDEDVPFFNECMKQAKGMGLSWHESLEYTIEERGKLMLKETASTVEFAEARHSRWDRPSVLGAGSIG